MTDESRKQAEAILNKTLEDNCFWLSDTEGNAIVKAMESYAALKVAEATKEIKFPTKDDISKAAMIFDKQKRPLWKEAIYRAGANWAIDWIKQNISK